MVDIEDQLEMIINMDILFNIRSILSKVKVSFISVVLGKNVFKMGKFYKKKEFKLDFFQFFYVNEEGDL